LQTDLREGGSRNRSKNIAYAHSRAMSLAVLMSLVFPMISIPAEMVSAAQTTVNYIMTTEDLFPEIPRLDVIVRTDWSVQYTANDGSGAPGTPVSYPVTATAGPGSITVWWWYNGTLIQYSNSRTIPHNAPIGDEADIPLYSDGTVTILLTIHASIDGVITNTGPGSVSPTYVSWTSWGTQTSQVSINSDAQDGQTIALSTVTTYAQTLTVTVTITFPSESFTSSPVSKMAAGDAPIMNSVTVTGSVIPEFNVVLPVAFIAMLVLLLCNRERRKVSG